MKFAIVILQNHTSFFFLKLSHLKLMKQKSTTQQSLQQKYEALKFRLQTFPMEYI